MNSKIFLLSEHSPKSFNFENTDKAFKTLVDRDCKEYLMKWDIEPNLKLLAYSFERNFDEKDTETFIKDVFLCDKIAEALNFTNVAKADEELSGQPQISLEIEKVPCTILSMDLFDKIEQSGIVIDDGTIKKCFEDHVDDMVISDELQKMLLQEESDHYGIYDDSERGEFLFRIFKHLCLGGSCNQYEDNIGAYLTLTQTLYKDLLCVRKTGREKTITIRSHVFKVTCYRDKLPTYPSERLHKQDFLYFIVDPIDNHLFILMHAR